VEDSGDWCVFIEGGLNPKPSNLLSPNLQTLIPHMLISVKPLYKGLALYMQNHGLSSPFMHENALKKFSDFLRKDLNVYKKLKKIL
jgi:hypothetical protein